MVVEESKQPSECTTTVLSKLGSPTSDNFDGDSENSSLFLLNNKTKTFSVN